MDIHMNTSLNSSSRNRRKSRKPLKSCVSFPESGPPSPLFEMSPNSPLPPAPLTPPLSDVQCSLSPCSSIYSGEETSSKLNSKTKLCTNGEYESLLERLPFKSCESNKLKSTDASYEKCASMEENTISESSSEGSKSNLSNGNTLTDDENLDLRAVEQSTDDEINGDAEELIDNKNKSSASLRNHFTDSKIKNWPDYIPSTLSISPVPSDKSCEKPSSSHEINNDLSQKINSSKTKTINDSFSTLLNKLKEGVSPLEQMNFEKKESVSSSHNNNSEETSNIFNILNSLNERKNSSGVGESDASSNADPTSPSADSLHPANLLTESSSPLQLGSPASKMFLPPVMNPVEYMTALHGLGLNPFKNVSLNTEELPHASGLQADEDLSSAANLLLQQQLKSFPYFSAHPFYQLNGMGKGIIPEGSSKMDIAGGRKPRSLNHTKSFHCSFCSKRFSHKEELEKHVLMHSKDELGNETYMQKSFACTECSFRTKYKFCLQRHMHIHTGDKPLVCPHCRYRSISKVSYDNHLRTHTGEKPFLCPYCDYKSSFKNNLTKHLKTHTSASDADKTFQCAKCLCCFNSQVQLKNHMKLHLSSENCHTCSICNYTFMSKFELEFHMRSHVVT